MLLALAVTTAGLPLGPAAVHLLPFDVPAIPTDVASTSAGIETLTHPMSWDGCPAISVIVRVIVVDGADTLAGEAATVQSEPAARVGDGMALSRMNAAVAAMKLPHRPMPGLIRRPWSGVSIVPWRARQGPAGERPRRSRSR